MPHELNLRRGQAVGLADDVAERALQVQGFSGKGAGGGDGAGVLVPQRVQTGGGLVSIVRTDACSTARRRWVSERLGMGDESRVTQAIGRVKRDGPRELKRLKRRLEQVYESINGETEI